MKSAVKGSAETHIAKSKPGRRGYLPTLDGWRAIAVSSVVARHYLLGRQCSGTGAPHWCGITTAFGMKGVSLFFAISGFLICSRLLEEQRVRGKISLREFYIRRAFRILPPAFWYLIVIGALALLGVLSVSLREWIAALTFWRDYGFDGSYGWFTGHFWSLSVEEKFYLFWPAVLVFAGSTRALRVGLCLALGIGLWRAVDLHWMITHRAFGLPSYSFTYRADTRLDALLFGCVVAILLDNPDHRAWVTAHLNQFVQLMCIALVAGVISESGLKPNLASILEAMAMPVMIASTVLAPLTLLARLLESRILVWIGRLSYSIYLWQQLFLDEVSRPAWLEWGPAALLCILACAMISYYGIERPFLRLGHRLVPPVTPGRPDATTSHASSAAQTFP